MRPGFTLLELAIAIALLAIALAIAIPSYRALGDGLAVDGAATSLFRTLADARSMALRSSTRVAVHADTAGATLLVRSVHDSLSVPLGQLFHVRLAASRDSIAYTGMGLGYGAANARYVVSRGARAETVTVSRAGRVRR